MADISKERLKRQNKHRNFNPQLKAISTTVNTVKPLAYEEIVT